jgi:predicted GTPase
VLVVEDGPTITHGGLPEGVGASAARNAGASLVDPRKYAVGTIAEAFQKYKHIGPVLPALGYSEGQIKDLERSIQNVECDAVVLGTPADLRRLMKITKLVYRVRFEIVDDEHPKFATFIKEKISDIRK